MGRGYNNSITGQCINTILNNNIRILRTCTTHVAFSSPTGNNYNSGVFTCGQNKSYFDGTPFTPYYGTQQIPDFYTPPSAAIKRASYTYGQTSNAVQLVTYLGDPVYFCEADLEPWRPRAMYVPNNIYNLFAQGPALQSSHAWDVLQRKQNNNNTYIDRKDYDFVNGYLIKPTTSTTTTEAPPATSTTTPEPEKFCELDNWLIYGHPATPLWTNLSEPFVATQYYEQSGEFPPRQSALGGQNFMPFCSPVPARDYDGNILGNYIGYSFSFKFGQATMAFPVRPYLPTDPDSPFLPPPFVNPRQAFYSMEVDVFLTSDNDDLASPLLNRKRYWLYVKDGLSGSGALVWEPYFGMLLGPMNSMWYFDVVFNYINNSGSETIKFNLSDMNVLVSA